MVAEDDGIQRLIVEGEALYHAGQLDGALEKFAEALQRLES